MTSLKWSLAWLKWLRDLGSHFEAAAATFQFPSRSFQRVYTTPISFQSLSPKPQSLPSRESHPSRQLALLKNSIEAGILLGFSPEYSLTNSLRMQVNAGPAHLIDVVLPAAAAAAAACTTTVAASCDNIPVGVSACPAPTMESWVDEQLAGEPASVCGTLNLQQQDQPAIPPPQASLPPEQPATKTTFQNEAVRFCAAADGFVAACSEGLNLLLRGREVVFLPAGTVAEGGGAAMEHLDDGLLALLEESLAGLEQSAASARLYTYSEAA